MLVPFLLSTAVVPQYGDIPDVSRKKLVGCRYAYQELDNFVAQANGQVWQQEVDRGGKLTWNQGNTIRDEVRTTARPYLERIRYIGWQGRTNACWKLSHEGQLKVYKVLLKYFSK